MLDMGFIPDIRRILSLLPAKRQNLLFSATFSDEIRALADGLLDRPARIEATPRNSTVEAVAQRVHLVDRDRKRELLAYLIGQNAGARCWCSRAPSTARTGWPTSSSTTASPPRRSTATRARARAPRRWPTSRTAGARAGRDRHRRAGLDIDHLPHVVNYELPNVPEDYVHRIGRTGRAGAAGEALSLVCVDEHAFLRDIERLIKRTLPREVVAGFEPDPRAKPEPVFASRGQRPAQPRKTFGGHAAAPGRGGDAHRRQGTKPPARVHHAAGPHGSVDRRGRDGGRGQQGSRTR